MQMTRHKTRSVFEHYNIVSECDLVREVAKILNLLQPIPPASNREECLPTEATKSARREGGHNRALHGQSCFLTASLKTLTRISLNPSAPCFPIFIISFLNRISATLVLGVSTTRSSMLD